MAHPFGIHGSWIEATRAVCDKSEIVISVVDGRSAICTPKNLGFARCNSLTDFGHTVSLGKVCIIGSCRYCSLASVRYANENDEVVDGLFELKKHAMEIMEDRNAEDIDGEELMSSKLHFMEGDKN